MMSTEKSPLVLDDGDDGVGYVFDTLPGWIGVMGVGKVLSTFMHGHGHGHGQSHHPKENVYTLRQPIAIIP
jgi:hypothetical protein